MNPKPFAPYLGTGWGGGGGGPTFCHRGNITVIISVHKMFTYVFYSNQRENNKHHNKVNRKEAEECILYIQG